MDPITVQALKFAQVGARDAGATTERATAALPAPLDDLAPGQFSDLMGAVKPGQESAQVTPRPEGLAGPRSLGDAILTGLTQLTTDVQQAWSAMHTGMTSQVQPVSLSEIYAKQVQLLDFTLQYQTIGYGWSKANQDLNELLKLQ